MTIKVNVSDKEDKSGEFQPLPAGLYFCIITDVEPKASGSDKNFGKPMLYFRFTIQEGPYAGRAMGSNACLWDGALYTIINLLKAVGEYDNCKSGGSLEIPDAPEFYLGREIDVRRGINQKAKKENPTDDPGAWLEVKGFAPHKTTSGTVAGSKSPGNNLLP